MDAGSNTFATVTNLEPGVTYHFEVSAYDTNNYESQPSQPIDYTVPSAAQSVTLQSDPPNAGIVSGDGNFDPGSSVTVTAVANNGYTFTNWTENGIIQSASSNYTFSVAGNRNLVANFSLNPVTYTITASAGSHGKISPSGSQTVLAGGSVTFTATPASGYLVDQWKVDGIVAQSAGSACAVQNITTNEVVTVSFSAMPKISVSANLPNAGSVSGGGSFAGGSSVTVAAIANSGYTFTNWTENSIVQSASPSYTFNVVGNRSLVANFTVNPITYAITAIAGDNGSISPSGSQTVVSGSSVIFTAAPTNDYQVDQWLVNGQLVQTGGSNYTLQNVTATNEVVVTFSPNPTVTVLANPPTAGSVTGGGVFVAGSTATLRATANSGYTFSNWTENGFVQSTSPSNSFSVTTNRTLVANFTVNPFVYIVTAGAGNNGAINPLGPQAVVAGGSMTFTGAPANGFQVSQWLLNGVAVQNGGSTYTLQNVVTNEAVTALFNVDLTIASNVPALAVPTNANTNFSLVIQGEGRVIPNAKGGVFQAGRKYTLTAIAAKGSVFANWVSNGIIVAITRRYTFLAESNVTLEANFIPNPFTPVMGAYHGLFYDTNAAAEESSGSFAATVSGAGGFTARIHVGALNYAWSGKFSVDGGALKTIPRPGLSPVTVQLQLALSNGPMTGTVSDGSWTASLLADPSIYSGQNHAPQAGRYTLLFPGADNGPLPAGNGFGTITVDALGNVSLGGMMGDGTPVFSTSVVSTNGQWPLYISLYGGKGSVLGWLAFTNNGIDGPIAWFRLPEPKAKLYPDGFAGSAETVGSAYHDTRGLPLGFLDGLLSLSNGDLAQSISDQIGLGPQVQSAAHSADKLTFMPASGLFRGAALDPATGKPVPFSGVVLQNQNFGAGLFMGTNETGSVLLSAAP